MTESHPDPWLYAGIIREERWTRAAVEFERWDQTTEWVRPGDTMLVMYLPIGRLAVGVSERASATAVA